MTDIVQFGTNSDMSGEGAPAPRSERGSIGYVLVLSGVLVAVAVTLAFLDR